MAGEVVATAIAEEAVRSCFEMVGRYISYTRKYKKNIKILEVELKKIEGTKDRVLREVEIAENNAEDIRQDVRVWLERCEELISNANELLQPSMPFDMSCLCCSCPNLKSRYQASSGAAELTSLITPHLEEGMFNRVGQQPQLGLLPLLSPGEYHGFGSRAVIKKQVTDGLKNDSITVIGLSGMGGVGKTTLVKKIAEDVKNEKLFDEVAFVVVSQDANVKAIQDELASRLDLQDIKNEMSIHRRAELLYKRLMDEKKKILVILDDIWQELNLRSVGIPAHGDRKGFKILMTSRYDSVCTDMKVQKKLQVDILSEDEAWNLFMITAEISDDTILAVAKEVSQECGRLPLAIVIVGKSLRNKKEHSFRHVLRKLRDPSTSSTSGVHSVLYSCIKSSYDYLESDEHRSLLLLCSLFPEDFDIQIEDLVRYSRGLSDTFKLMEEVRDRVKDIVDELMGCYLLLPDEKKKCVKLHDVVRDFCISMAMESGDVNIFSKFDDLPKKLSGLKSQRLRLLRLVNKESFWKSSYFSKRLILEETENKEINFFEEMEELRVLEVNYITISLPTSLQFMFNLQTLSLDHCRLEGDFAGIGRLKMLRVLSFFHSIIEMFPMEIAELTNLQCLDLRFHFNVQTTLPLGTLSGLNELEELYLGDHVLGSIESFKEFHSLPKLHTIQFVFDRDDSCLEVVLKILNLSQLRRFDITLGNRGIEYQIRENVLHLERKNVHLLKTLLPRAKLFELNGEGLANVVDLLGEGNGFKNLEALELHECDMKYLVDATNHHLPNGIFGKLEELEITYASQLEELIHGDHQFGASSSGLHELNQENLNVRGPFQFPLRNLRRLQIAESDKIKSLFSKSMVNCLRNLNTIEVRKCSIFEKIVTSIEDEQVDCLEVFQTLQNLSLVQLPEFKSFGPQPGLMAGFNQIMLPELEDLNIELNDSIKEREGEAEQQELCFYLGCSLPKVRYLKIRKCNNLFTIAKSGLLHGFQKLENLKVFSCLSLEVVFDFDETTLLGQLKILELKSLPKLKHIWRMLPKETPTQNLKKIEVIQCGSLRYLLTPTVANMLGHLEEIMLQENELMEAVIGIDENDMPNDGDGFPLGRIALPKLKSLTVEGLPRFRKLCYSPDLTLDLPSLSNLRVSDCFSLEVLFNFEETMSERSAESEETTLLGQLEILELKSLPKLKHIWRMLPKETPVFQNLKKIDVKHCGSLRYLLTPTVANMLGHLEEIMLIDNELMEAVIGRDENDGDEFLLGRIVLPKLKSFTIKELPCFRKLCYSSPDIIVELPCLTELRKTLMVEDILTRDQISRLTSLTLWRNRGRKHPLTPSLVELLAHIQELKLGGDDKLMEAIIGSDKSDDTKSSIVFPELQNLGIYNLPNLRKLCFSPDLTLELPSLIELWIRNSAVDILTRETHTLQNLTKVVIFYCDSFKYLLTSSAQVLVHLEELLLHSNRSMESIFGFESSDEEDIPNNTIVLPKLRKLYMKLLGNFRMLCCSSNVNVELPSLTQLCIWGCPKMIKLCAGQLSTPKLTHVSYASNEIDLGTFINSWLKDRESMIRCLDCSYKRSETCDHFDNQSKESENAEEELAGKHAIGSNEEESLVMNTQN